MLRESVCICDSHVKNPTKMTPNLHIIKHQSMTTSDSFTGTQEWQGSQPPSPSPPKIYPYIIAWILHRKYSYSHYALALQQMESDQSE